MTGTEVMADFDVFGVSVSEVELINSVETSSSAELVVEDVNSLRVIDETIDSIEVTITEVGFGGIEIGIVVMELVGIMLAVLLFMAVVSVA